MSLGLLSRLGGILLFVPFYLGDAFFLGDAFLCPPFYFD